MDNVSGKPGRFTTRHAEPIFKIDNYHYCKQIVYGIYIFLLRNLVQHME